VIAGIDTRAVGVPDPTITNTVQPTEYVAMADDDAVAVSRGLVEVLDDATLAAVVRRLSKAGKKVRFEESTTWRISMESRVYMPEEQKLAGTKRKRKAKR
jgi:hypothetical protein